MIHLHFQRGGYMSLPGGRPKHSRMPFPLRFGEKPVCTVLALSLTNGHQGGGAPQRCHSLLNSTADALSRAVMECQDRMPGMLSSSVPAAAKTLISLPPRMRALARAPATAASQG